MLNYPRRDCASLALEEVKRFLESADPSSKIRKIIFVVFSSNDEFVYKSVVPVYFPPIDLHVNRALPASITRQATGATISSESSGAPRRTLFSSVGDALRSVRFGKQPESSRAITANEEHALIGFEAHAKGCENCIDVKRLYREEQALCKEGYSLAQTVLWHMNMQSDQKVYTKPDSKGQIVQLEVPADMFPISMSFLATVEKGHQDGDGPYGAIIHQQELRFCDTLLAALMGPRHSAISHPFVTPVDPVALNIPTYSRIIKKPMDFGTIEKNLKNKVYHSAEEFYSDVQLVFSNCYNFNPEGSVVNTLGKQMQKIFEDLWKEKSDWLAGHETLLGKYPKMNSDIQDKDQGMNLAEEQLKKVRAQVVTRSSAADKWTTVTSDECQVRVYSNKVFILEMDGMETNRRPLVWLELVASTVVERHKTTPEVLLVGATHLQSSRAQTEGEVLFRCRTDYECNSLLRMLRSAIEILEEGQPGTSGPRDGSERTDTDNYPKWNQRIRDIRDELASVKKATGGLTDLQYKMERLNAASSSRDTRPQQASAVADLYDTLRSPLATRVLLCLIADMQSRPGSYIGLGTDSIVSALRSKRGEVMLALEELEAEGQVHDTLDSDTWVVTHMPKDLPAVSADQFEEAPRKTGFIGESQTEPIQSDSGSQGIMQLQPDDSEAATQESSGAVTAPGVEMKTTLQPPQASTLDVQSPTAPSHPPSTDQIAAHHSLTPEATKVHTYLLNYTFAPPDGAHHILDIAAAVYLSREEVRLALAQLRDLGLANVTGKDGWWWATKAESPTPAIRAAPSFTATRPSPTTGPAPSAPIDLDTLDISAPAAHPGTPHTRLDKRLVDAAVLIAADERYEDDGDSLVVHRVLRRGEMEAWARESKMLRDEVQRFKEKERRGWEDTDRGVRDVLRMVGAADAAAGTAGDAAVVGEDSVDDGVVALEERARRKWRRSGEKAKGKDMDKDRRDEDQERLDRVIAGDIKEEETMRWTDRDDERYD
jgi:hypothetical protein